MIHLRDVTISYGRLPALEQVTFDVAPGAWALLSGASGCGKSTLARVLGGLIPHAIPAKVSGEVSIAGIDPRQSTIPDIAQHVGLVFQNPSTQLFHIRVEDEVAFGPRNLGLPEDEVQQRMEWAIQVTNLEALRQRRPTELSGGQKQCVAVAGALAMKPKVLVLDEPTASLDVANTRRVLDTLKCLQQEHGITILMIEHRLAGALQMADQIILLENGRLIVDGRPAEVLNDPGVLRRLGLRRPAEEPVMAWGDLINGKAHHTGLSIEQNLPELEPSDVQPPAFTHVPLCEQKKSAANKTPMPGIDPSRTPLVHLQSVNAGYNGHNVLEDVNLDIYPGDFLALVGENGAGKSTLALVIAGLLKPRAGQVTFLNGKKPKPGQDVGILFQNPATQIFMDSVDEEVAYGPKNYGCFNEANHLQSLQATGLQSLRQRRPTRLSMGQQQRTAMAASLALRPRLLILDEPTLGQDWAHLQLLMTFLQELNASGMAILLISHDYKLIHRFARRLVLLENGHIKKQGRLKKPEWVD